MFYWFFRNTNATVPLRPIVLWLNGGPGSSSMGGLFGSLGPIMINKTGATENDWEILPRDRSWADDYHLIFVDQPVDTGFSRTDNISIIPQNMSAASQEFRVFLESFYNMYPDLKENDLYIAGESYAGKYIPFYIYEMLEHNKVNLTY